MEPSDYTALASVIVASCALGFTIWQGMQTRRHNILSVKPHLGTWTDSQPDKRLYTIELLNNGIGPALIKNFSIYVDDRLVDGYEDGTKAIKKALKILFPNYTYDSYRSYVGPGYMMAPKESRTLVRVQFTGKLTPPPEEVDRTINRAKLIINYESIYEEAFRLDSSEKILNPKTNRKEIMSDWHKEETYKSMIQISLSTLRFSLLSNGGAVVALLTLFGATSASTSAPSISDISAPLSFFLGGIFLGGIAHVFAYLTQLTLHSENMGDSAPPKHTGWLGLAIFCVVLSIFCFGFGAFSGVKAFS